MPPTTAPAALRRRPEPGGRTRTDGLVAFVVLAYGLTWLLLIGAYVGMRAGVISGEGPLAGLIVQIAAASPLIAAVIVLSMCRGRPGLVALGRGLVHWRVNPLWYVFVFAGVPLLMLASSALVHGGALLSTVTERWTTLVPRFPVFVIGIAIVTGLAEEPGWRGYALPLANERYAPFAAALLVSVLWAMWHLPNALFSSDGAGTQLAHVVATTVNGLLHAWVFNATRGSILIAMLLHGSLNATAGVIMQLLDEAGRGGSLLEYYVLSAAAFGTLMGVVTMATRGRLGARPTPLDSDPNLGDKTL